MDVLKRALFLSSILLISSCSRISYLTDQGIGQIKLISNARPNSEVVKDEKIPIEKRQKIQRIEELRDYYYRYWEMEPGEIYTKTTVLDRDAVSYLVIASPYNDISPKEECFPIMGCFPYLGFFDKKDALKHAEKLKRDDYVTWVRPVYAYSTLGHLNDPILTSFFQYDDYELVEMVFHELFHTMFFIKSDVDFNENLANFIAREMAFEYFNYDESERTKKRLEVALDERQRKLLVDAANELKDLYKRSECTDPKGCNQILENFNREVFAPKIDELCKDKNCWLSRGKWNNASFAAFMTYEKSGDLLSSIYKRVGGGPKQFYTYINQQYDIYKRSEKEQRFDEFLRTQERKVSYEAGSIR